jgi:hypothetical protein
MLRITWIDLDAWWGIPGCSSQTESDAGKISGPMGKMDTGKMGGSMDKMDRPMDKMDTDKMGGSMDKMDTDKMAREKR